MVILQVNILLCNDDMGFIIIIEERTSSGRLLTYDWLGSNATAAQIVSLCRLWYFNSSSSVLNPGMNSQVKNQMCISEHLSSPNVSAYVFRLLTLFDLNGLDANLFLASESRRRV
jgi:hypothetical protein